MSVCVCIQGYRRAFIAARTPVVARAARPATRRPCAVPQLLAHCPVLLKIAAAISVAPAPSPCVSRSSRASAIASFWAWAPPSKPRQRGDSQSSGHDELSSALHSPASARPSLSVGSQAAAAARRTGLPRRRRSKTVRAAEIWEMCDVNGNWQPRHTKCALS